MVYAQKGNRVAGMKSNLHSIYDIRIPADTVTLDGTLGVPHDAHVLGVVLFAHGSGSSRLSPRNTYVAQALRNEGMTTLLFDLLTETEALDRENVFDIDLLAARLRAATQWVTKYEPTRGLVIGYFGASTGAAAALVAAAGDPAVRAIVSRGGRPDLAERSLAHVLAPTLLIVGGNDEEVIILNREAFELLPCEKAIAIVQGATHLFEEPGALDQVVNLAADWFKRHLKQPSQ